MHINVGPPFFAARRPAENSCFSIGNTALRLVLSWCCWWLCSLV